MAEFKSIKDWDNEDKPREKLMEKGAQSLTNAELLAILINTGTKSASALDIGKEVMQLAQQNLLEMQQLTYSDLNAIKGLGPKKVITLLAALELGRRTRLAIAIEKEKITSSKQAFEVLQSQYTQFQSEQFVVLYLNQANNICGLKMISDGGLTSTVVDIRMVFQYALALKKVTRIIISHNHPSGNLKPSQADIRLTQKIKEAGDVLDIKLVDHIIIGQNAYYSFLDEGQL